MYNKYRVTYHNVGMVQEMYCIPQDAYNAFRIASNIKGDKQRYKEVSPDLQSSIDSTISNFKEEERLFKKGLAFTDRSPIGLALTANDGFLRLPDHQGGVSKITFELIENTVKEINFDEE